jgi:hypothetical protein
VGIAGPDDRVVEGAELAEGGVHPGLTTIARVRPEQKVDVVRALQADAEVVAMLGDGVNDAPALRAADIGVAAGRGGTEVARQAPDLVLMDDDLATVVAAVEEGRRIYANVRTFLVYAVSGGLAEVAVMLLGPLVGLPLPLLPGQVLWINLLTHGLTGVAFGAEPADPRNMSRPPHARGESVFDARSRLMLVVATAACPSRRWPSERRPTAGWARAGRRCSSPSGSDSSGWPSPCVRAGTVRCASAGSSWPSPSPPDGWRWRSTCPGRPHCWRPSRCRPRPCSRPSLPRWCPAAWWRSSHAARRAGGARSPDT